MGKITRALEKGPQKKPPVPMTPFSVELMLLLRAFERIGDERQKAIAAFAKYKKRSVWLPLVTAKARGIQMRQEFLKRWEHLTHER